MISARLMLAFWPVTAGWRLYQGCFLLDAEVPHPPFGHLLPGGGGGLGCALSPPGEGRGAGLLGEQKRPWRCYLSPCIQP